MKLKTISSLVLAAMLSFTGFSIFAAKSAFADSCWNHNGSIMRLKASGQNRWFYYERPRAGLSVGAGTLLFNGRNNGGYYTGTARVFSKYCPGNPLEYYVEGPVERNQTRVVVRGTRDVYNRCQPTGNVKTDVLVFDYAYKC